MALALSSAEQVAARWLSDSDSKSGVAGIDTQAACHATLRIWDASRLSTGRDGFDSRTWRRT